ncbi:D-alanine--D-alanine ligase [Nitrospira sp.]|nr:D-alanine--D-alanine ligase [Nitrospira sp.]
MSERAPLTQGRIGVLMGGRSAERDVSLRTGQAVYQALLRRGYDAVTIDVGPSIVDELRNKKIDLVFIALHGPGGEDGTIQGLLETLRLPYTGSGVRASAVAMHKVLTKTVLAAAGVPVPRGEVVVAGRVTRPSLPKGLKWPVIVKPATQGSTIGVSIVRKPAEWTAALAAAHQYDTEAVVEAFVPGHELTVGVLRSEGKTDVLPAVEIVAPSGFYDFSAKYQKGKTQYVCPAPISAKTAKTLRALAASAYDALACEGAARVDFRVTPRGAAYVLEANTIPGMTETSLLPMAAAKAGIDYDSLVERILDSALVRQRVMATSVAEAPR